MGPLVVTITVGTLYRPKAFWFSSNGLQNLNWRSAFSITSGHAIGLKQCGIDSLNGFSIVIVLRNFDRSRVDTRDSEVADSEVETIVEMCRNLVTCSK
jgi:hypothetical protein